MAGLVLF